MANGGAGVQAADGVTGRVVPPFAKKGATGSRGDFPGTLEAVPN
jgi:hypothetical protein